VGKSNDVYLGNPLLKRAHTEGELTYEQIIELARCEQDPLYFASNYIQIVTLDHGLQPFSLYKFQEKMLRTFHDNRFIICKLPRQPLALDTPVPTPRGWTTIGKLKVGDRVFSSAGQVTRVVAKSETYTNAECYRISFDCEESIVVESDHLWELFLNGEKVIKTTAQLFQNRHNNYTLKRAPLKGKNKRFPENWDNEITITSIERADTVPVACIEVKDDTHMFLCGKNFIPQKNCGKSTTVVSYLIHSLIFNEKFSIAILANKASTAKDLLARLAVSYENLPKWIQAGVKSWNKTSVELENGSKVMAASTSASAVRGGSYNIIFLDEFAFVPNQIAANFMNSVYPTITSGDNSKVIIVSTPNGMNLYYKMWDDALNKRNEYVPIEINWNDVPGRDDEWRRSVISNIGELAFEQEFVCSFLGSSNTLISGSKLGAMKFDKPIKSRNSLDVYEEPIKDHAYVLTVDVARGVNKDYSAFSVIDITKMPYKQVAKYRDNQIKPLMFPYVIKDVAEHYNRAYILCEVNDVGDQVATGLHDELEYDNMLMCSVSSRKGQVVGQNFSEKAAWGVKMQKNVKRIGCLNLKALIEEDKLLINDLDTINELTTFIAKAGSWEADDGKNDDLVITLIIFAWLCTNQYFKDLQDQDLRKKLFEEKMANEEDDMLPFGFVDLQIEGDASQDSEGNLWMAANPEREVEHLAQLWEYFY
jgi:hypothetical protein